MSRREWPAWARLSDVIDLLKLSLPIAISRSAFMLMLLTDTIVLGRNAPEEVPYILIAWFPVSVFMGAAMGLMLGVSVITAELSGRGEASDTGRVFRRGGLVALVFGAVAAAFLLVGAAPLFRLLQFEGEMHAGVTSVARILSIALIAQLLNSAIGFYLEALRRPTFVAVVMYCGVAFNIAFDLVFVAGWFGFPTMGATGVAMATAGTSWCMFLVFLAVAFIATPAFKPSAPAPPGEFSRQFKVGTGMVISNVAEFGSFNFTHVVAGWISVVAATLYGMVFQVIGFVFMLFLGLGTATSVRVAERYGRSDPDGVVNASRLGVVTCIMVGVTAAVGLLMAHDLIALVFVQRDAEVGGVLLHPMLASLVTFAAFILIFDGLQNVAALASRARGLAWLPAGIHIGSYMFVMVPLAYVFGVGMGRGVQGMLEAVLIASVIASILQLIVLEKFARRLPESRTAEE